MLITIQHKRDTAASAGAAWFGLYANSGKKE